MECTVGGQTANTSDHNWARPVQHPVDLHSAPRNWHSRRAGVIRVRQRQPSYLSATSKCRALSLIYAETRLSLCTRAVMNRRSNLSKNKVNKSNSVRLICNFTRSTHFQRRGVRWLKWQSVVRWCWQHRRSCPRLAVARHWSSTFRQRRPRGTVDHSPVTRTTQHCNVSDISSYELIPSRRTARICRNYIKSVWDVLRTAKPHTAWACQRGSNWATIHPRTSKGHFSKMNK